LCSMPTARSLLRGDGAGIHTLGNAHDKAYTSVSFKNDTIALAERAKGEAVSQLPCFSVVASSSSSVTRRLERRRQVG
jgi:uncharacterized protein GlcG (DUF336 family)